MRKIIFRADGGSIIGMGHFIRSLALAEMLNKDFYCIFATQKPTEFQRTEIEKVCFSRIDLPEDDSHFQIFLNKLEGNEIVVLDNYYFDTKYQNAIKTKGCKLVCIDEMHDKHFVADMIINHAEGIMVEQYSKENYTKLLMGCQYALLRRDFLAPKEIQGVKDYSCLIIIGGADPFNITHKIMSFINDFDLPKPIAVVTGSDVLKPIGSRRFRFFNKITAAQVSELMKASDFGIFPASTVALEACAMRLPFVCGYFIDNQVELYKGLKSKNVAVCVGDLNWLEQQQLKEALISLNKSSITDRIIKNQEQLLDKKSNERIILNFEELWNLK